MIKEILPYTKQEYSAEFNSQQGFLRVRNFRGDVVMLMPQDAAKALLVSLTNALGESNVENSVRN